MKVQQRLVEPPVSVCAATHAVMPLGPTCRRQKGFSFWMETSAVTPLTCGPFASQGPTCLPLESLCRLPVALLEAQPSRPQLPFCHLPSSRPINLAGFLPHWGFLPPLSPPTFHFHGSTPPIDTHRLLTQLHCEDGPSQAHLPQAAA